jgi:hypothetical protein
MSFLTVGVGLHFDTIAKAVAASQSGDTIEVQAGTYTNDFTHIDHSLTLQAVGGMVFMQATVPAPGGKAILSEGGVGIDVNIDGFAFTGATVPDANGAGIRYEGGMLTITNCLFKDNQDGILGAADPNGMISISHSEFDHNGVGGNGSTHNIYIGDISSFTLTDSYSHDANVGHEIKSRAENNTITNDRIFDDAGTSSYSIDLPNGGNATITGNIIEQGVNSENPNIIAYGEEGNLHAGTALTVASNIFINDKAAGPTLWNTTGGTVANFTDNAIYGFNNIPLVNGASNQSGTVVLGARPALDQSSPVVIPDPVCYLRGTHILTLSGETFVEDLKIGDHLVTRFNGIQPIKWIGRRRIDLLAHPHPEVVAPVRIQRSAVADDVPHRDLLVSPDHAVFVDGKLICARQLVNGTTIRQEQVRTSVEYFHIELDAHAILLAEGLPAESYLNTGNRGFFANSGDPLMLHPDLTDETDYPTREARSCAPFVFDEAGVWPVWQRLVNREEALGYFWTAPATTEEAGLHLLANGQSIWPVAVDGGQYVFALPAAQAGCGSMRLVSRSASPSDLVPYPADRRRLGVAVTRIVVRSGEEPSEIPVDHLALSRGWHEAERDGGAPWRWTNGDAILPLPTFSGPVLLEVHLGGTMTYIITAEPETEAQPKVA